MTDFYDNLSRLENEAMRRARKIGAAEQRAAEQFQAQHQSHRPPPPPKHHEHPAGGLLGSRLFGNELLRSPDMSLIMMLFFILNAEQSDPLLMLALAYILM